MIDKSLKKNQSPTAAPTARNIDNVDTTSDTNETVETPVRNDTPTTPPRTPQSLFLKATNAIRAANRFAAKVEEVTSTVNNVTQITAAVVTGEEVDEEHVVGLFETLTEEEDNQRDKDRDRDEEHVTMANVFGSTLEAVSALDSAAGAASNVADVLDTINSEEGEEEEEEGGEEEENEEEN